MDQDVVPAGRTRIFARAKGALHILKGKAPPANIVASRYRDTEVDDLVAHDVLDLTMRLGEALLASGSPVAGVTATMLRVAAAYGLTSCQVDITFTSITVSVTRDDGEPVTGMRIVKLRSADYSRLEALYLLADDAADGLAVDKAQARLDDIMHAPHPYRRWLVTAALGGMAAGVAWLSGGTWAIALAAAIATACIDRLMRLMNKWDMPSFFQHAAAAALVTVIAFLVGLVPYVIPYVSAGLLRPSLVVSTGITVLLAGLGLVGAVQDAISGHYLTAAARNFEVLLQTLAIVIGVSAVLDMIGRTQFYLPTALNTSPPTPPLGLAFVGALVAGMWALSSYSRWRACLVATLGGGAAFAIFVAMRELGLGPAVSSGLASLLIGVVADVSGNRLRVPTLVIATSGVVPLLPGLAVYQGLSLLVGGSIVEGLTLLLSAAAVGLALASGVALGSIIARPLRHEVDRWDRRVRRRARSVRD